MAISEAAGGNCKEKLDERKQRQQTANRRRAIPLPQQEQRGCHTNAGHAADHAYLNTDEDAYIPVKG